MFCAAFLPGYTCQNTVIVEILKDGSFQHVQIKSLASNKCFSYRNVFQNRLNALAKLVIHYFANKVVVKTLPCYCC